MKYDNPNSWRHEQYQRAVNRCTGAFLYLLSMFYFTFNSSMFSHLKYDYLLRGIAFTGAAALLTLLVLLFKTWAEILSDLWSDLADWMFGL